MNKCRDCPSYALNLWQQNIDTNGLCDLCYYKRDNARLRALIKEAEYACYEANDIDTYCPWCGLRIELAHSIDCPAFTPNGEVK